MQSTVFNPIQQQLLRMFSFNDSEESLLEMKRVLTEYYAKKVEKSFNQLWDEGILDQKKLNKIRTLYFHAKQTITNE